MLHICHIYYMPYHWELFQIGCSEVVFKLMLVEVRIKFDFMHVICMSSWAEWDGSDWLIKYPRGDYTYISVRWYDGTPQQSFIDGTMHVVREEYFHVMR